MIIPRAATVERFFVQISGNTLTTAGTTLQVLNLSVGGSVDILVLAGVSGLVSNLIDTLNFAQGELMGFEITIAGGGAGLFNMISMGAEVTWTA